MIIIAKLKAKFLIIKDNLINNNDPLYYEKNFDFTILKLNGFLIFINININEDLLKTMQLLLLIYFFFFYNFLLFKYINESHYYPS